ncbi:cytochrome p450 domain-containing protein [Ditylenchus destructor]|nr:cytochrome p450 domain-containing protein [Ditylenchus destructor]
MSVFLSVLFGFIIVSLIFYAKSFRLFIARRRRKIELGERIYGPPASAFIGNVRQMPPDSYGFTEYLIEFTNEAVAKGHNIVRLWFGNGLFVYPLNGEALKEILEDTREIKKGIDYDFYLQWLGEGLLLSHGEKWKKQRKMLTPTFHFNMLSGYIEAFNKHALTFTQVLNEFADGETVTDVYTRVGACTLDIIAETAMGIELKAQNNENQAYANAVHMFNFCSFKYACNPQWWIPGLWYFFGYAQQTLDSVRTLKDMSRNVIQERCKIYEKERQASLAETNPDNQVPKKRKAFLDNLLDMQEENKLSFEELREQVDTFMFAGHDTTAHAISWAIWSLACHPEIQNRAYVELTENLGPDPERYLTTEDLNSLKYLDMCVKETLRMFPSVPIVQRTLKNEMEIGGKIVPMGSVIDICPIMIHHNEKIYPNHESFDPENFSTERIRTRHAYDYIPFSAGPRNCIGQKFAMLEVKVVLVYILRRFRLSSTVDFNKNVGGTETVLRPKLGIPIRLHKRE